MSSLPLQCISQIKLIQNSKLSSCNQTLLSTPPEKGGSEDVSGGCHTNDPDPWTCSSRSSQGKVHAGNPSTGRTRYNGCHPRTPNIGPRRGCHTNPEGFMQNMSESSPDHATDSLSWYSNQLWKGFAQRRKTAQERVGEMMFIGMVGILHSSPAEWMPSLELNLLVLLRSLHPCPLMSSCCLRTWLSRQRVTDAGHKKSMSKNTSRRWSPSRTRYANLRDLTWKNQCRIRFVSGSSNAGLHPSFLISISESTSTLSLQCWTFPSWLLTEMHPANSQITLMKMKEDQLPFSKRKTQLKLRLSWEQRSVHSLLYKSDSSGCTISEVQLWLPQHSENYRVVTSLVSTPVELFGLHGIVS